MKKPTTLARAGRHPSDQHGFVNPPVYRGSTVIHPSLAALEEASAQRFDRIYYGRFGTPTSVAFEDAMVALDGGYRAVAVSSGMAAITAALLAFVGVGDHILVTDSAYYPTRALCGNLLARFGVETTFYDPLIGTGIAECLRPDTRLVFTESPGSHSFEVQDIPAIAAAAHDSGALVVMDNTWSAGLFFPAFTHGVDIAVQAATKYIVGHSDAMLGAISVANADQFDKVKKTVVALGNCPGSEECSLGLRGLRTLDVRLCRHQENGLILARWLAQRPEIRRVMHPALPEDPGHALWRRDFTGAPGLFGVVLDRDYPRAAIAAFIDGLDIFSLGASWGGFESLILPFTPATARSATTWSAPSPTLRFHAGLEDPEDMIADLERGFARLDAAARDGA